jgi:N-sulfoglucosamine sulfohydrolase
MVRFGDYLYIKNNYPKLPNLGHESDMLYLSGKELWKAHAAGQTQSHQQQIFAVPSPSEQLFHVSRDPYQLWNLSPASPLTGRAEPGSKPTRRLDRSRPATPFRRIRHRIAAIHPAYVDGKIIPMGKKHGKQNPHAEFPGAARNATTIHHPGPLRLE